MKTHIGLFFILIFFILQQKTNADDSLTPLYSLSEDVRSVVLKTPEGNPMPEREFHLSEAKADQMKALVGVDNLTRSYLEINRDSNCDDCQKNSDVLDLEKKVKKRDFEIYVSVLASDTKYEQNVVGRFMDNDYQNYIGKMFWDNNGNLNTHALNIYSLQSLEDTYKRLNPTVDLSKMSFNDKEKILNAFANSYLGTKLPDGLLMKEMAFDQMVNHSSTWRETLAAAKNSLTGQQKIELVSKVGGFFGNNYNYTRFNEGMNAKGYVTIEQLFDSLKNGTEGGVCRDVALAQTQMLKELGFKNNYVLAYKTLSGYHANVITTDPDTGKIVKFNYAETTSMKKGSGTEALTQDTTMPDHGLAFRIYDSTGKPVTQVPSELGQILKETTGEETRAFTDKHYSLYRAGVNIGGMDGNLFSGRTSSGENIYGVSLYGKKETENVSLNGGISLSKVEGNRTYMRIDQENLYARLSAEVRTPKLEKGSLSVNGFLGANGEGMIYNARESYISSNYTKSASRELDGSIDAYVGIKGTTKLGADTVVTNKTYATFYPDTANVAVAVAGIHGATIVRDNVTIQSGVTHSIDKNQIMLLESTVMLKNYGTSMGIKAAYENQADQMKISAGYETPLKQDMPTFLPGGTSRAQVGVEKEIKDGVIFSLEYDRDLTNGHNSGFLKASKKF